MLPWSWPVPILKFAGHLLAKYLVLSFEDLAASTFDNKMKCTDFCYFSTEYYGFGTFM